MADARSSSGFELEALEPRVMLSGDGVAGVIAPSTLVCSPSPSYSQAIEEVVEQSISGTSNDGLAYDATAQLDDIFGGSVEAMALPVTGDETVLSAASDSGELAGENGSSKVEESAAKEVSPAVIPALVPDPAQEVPAPVAPDTISQVDELVETLHAANGPPVSNKPQLAAAGDQFVDPDILAGPKQAILDGLTALGNWANSLDNFSKLAANLPVIGRNIGQMLDMGGILLSYLRDPVSNYFTNDATPTTDELLVALRNLDATVGGLTIAVADGSVTGGLLGGNEFRFNLVFQVRFFCSMMRFSIVLFVPVYQFSLQNIPTSLRAIM